MQTRDILADFSIYERSRYRSELIKVVVNRTQTSEKCIR